jgi:hypothetical protein
MPVKPARLRVPGLLGLSAKGQGAGELRPAGGDGQRGTAARARGGGVGPVRGGRGVGGGSLGVVRSGTAWCGEVGDGGGDQWSPVVPEW